MKTMLLLVLIPVYCIPLYAQTAKELNDTGYGLYKEGKFEVNGNHIIIHLNSSYRESREFKGILEQGRIKFENLDYAFSDDDDPCGA